MSNLSFRIFTIASALLAFAAAANSQAPEGNQRLRVVNLSLGGGSPDAVLRGRLEAMVRERRRSKVQEVHHEGHSGGQ